MKSGPSGTGSFTPIAALVSLLVEAMVFQIVRDRDRVTVLPAVPPFQPVLPCQIMEAIVADGGILEFELAVLVGDGEVRMVVELRNQAFIHGCRWHWMLIGRREATNSSFGRRRVQWTHCLLRSSWPARRTI